MSLVETLLVIGIMGTAGVAALMALSTGSLAMSAGDQGSTVQSLARSQLEYTKSYPYDLAAVSYPTLDTYHADYNPTPLTLPDCYSISIESSSVPDTDDNIQKITVTVFKDSEILKVVEGFKSNR
ncbi:hypothetical protein ACFLWV_04105 [Chloroflexota bacterium]